MLTKIRLKDLGKRSVSDTVQNCSEIAPGDDGNAGTWLTLNVSEITYTLDSMLNDKAEINRFENNDQNEIFGLSEVDKLGIAVGVITLRGYLIGTETSDLQTFAKIVKMCKTQGVKMISGVDNTKFFLNYINYYDDYYANISKTANQVLDGIYVRIRSLRVSFDANKNTIEYTLELVETK